MITAKGLCHSCHQKFLFLCFVEKEKTELVIKLQRHPLIFRFSKDKNLFLDSISIPIEGKDLHLVND